MAELEKKRLSFVFLMCFDIICDVDPPERKSSKRAGHLVDEKKLRIRESRGFFFANGLGVLEFVFLVTLFFLLVIHLFLDRGFEALVESSTSRLYLFFPHSLSLSICSYFHFSGLVCTFSCLLVHLPVV